MKILSILHDIGSIIKMQIDGGLRGLFRSHLTKEKFHFTSIETGGTSRGTPDSEYCYEGQSGWIEFKKSYGNTVRLSPEQIAWISQRKRCGGRAFIAVRDKRCLSKRILARDDLYLFDGEVVERLKEDGLKKVMPIGLWGGGPRKWVWKEVLGLLTS